MAGRRKRVSRQVIRHRLEKGYGKGHRDDYKPPITVRDFSSLGRVHRIHNEDIGRIQHTLSDLEAKYRDILEFAGVLDIREQYALDEDQTKPIAKLLGYKHPHTVITTDFLITVPVGFQTKHVARTCKYSADLQDRRTMEILEIERVTWAQQNVDWGIVTEKNIPEVLYRNVRHSLNYKSRTDLLSRCNITEEQLDLIVPILSKKVQDEEKIFHEICGECDNNLQLDPGTSIAIVYHLIANKHWIIDLLVPLEPMEPLALISIKEF